MGQSIGQWMAKAGLLVAGLASGLLLAEVAARLVVEPVNFLRPELEEDPVLIHRIKPGSGGHDEWGFRNSHVPDRVPIVAIGDSQTYGSSAPASGSWPAWLERLSKQPVYNLGLGGYAPLQYRHLLESRALDLEPSRVVVGFYLGNDLIGAYRAVYATEHWSFLRKKDSAAQLETGEHGNMSFGGGAAARARERGAWSFPLREWVRENSILYRMLAVTLGDVWHSFRLRALHREDPDVTFVEDPASDTSTALQAPYRFVGLDLDDPRVEEGLRLSLEALDYMHRVCDRSGVDLLVVLIPTKVSVYQPLVHELGIEKGLETIDSLVENEDIVRARAKTYLDASGIPWVDPLPALRNEATRRQIYPRSLDGHPTSEGYRVIAESVARRLGELQTEARSSRSAGRAVHHTTPARP